MDPDRLEITSHVNFGYEPENMNLDLLAKYNSDRDSNSSDFSTPLSSDCGSEPEWSESVGSKGELFYVENSKSSEAKNDSILLESNSENRFNLRAKDKLGGGKSVIANENEKSVKTNQKLEIKDITLRVKKNQVKHSVPSSKLCESILGIILGEETNCDYRSSLRDNRRVLIKGFVPGGIAMKSELFCLGDVILKIDGKDIVNIESISVQLSKIIFPKKRISLQIERKLVESTLINTRDVKDKDKSFILKLIKPGLDQFEIKDLIIRDVHAVIYLRNSGNAAAASSPSDGIVYQYPVSNCLSSLSGMFITIAHLISEITNSSLRSSSLVLNNKVIRINYYQEGNDLLLIALPQESLSNEAAESLILNVTRLIKWKFFSLGRAFTEKEHRKTLDHLFKLFFYSVLNDTLRRSNYTFFECLEGIPQQILGHEVQERIDNLLSELEAGDFGDISESFFDTKRLYLILGSALFYKGMLCVSHLPKEDLVDFYLYIQYFQLINLTTENEVGQIIVWQEVYPTRRQKTFHNVSATNNFDFQEQEGRWFTLIVALNNCLLCVLLEVGGCTARAGNHPRPDPFYVDQVRNVLLKMNETEIASQIEKGLRENPNTPELADPNIILNKMKESTSKLRLLRPQPQLAQNKSLSLSRHMLHRKETLGKYSISHSSLLSSPGKKFQDGGGGMSPKKLASYHGDLEKQSLLSHNSPPDDFDHERSLSPHNDSSSMLYNKNGAGHVAASSSCSDAESRTSSEDIYRGLKSRRVLSGSFDLSSLRTDLDDIESESCAESPKLLSGRDVNLLHYIHLNTGEGILISPNEDVLPIKDSSNSLRSQIISSFQNCVTNIHKVFQTTMKNKDLAKKDMASKFADNVLPPIKEHGVLFHITPNELLNANNQAKKTASTLAFWVIGRMFMVPEPKEVYVCFQDSTAQNLVELAFKLSFGNLY